MILGEGGRIARYRGGGESVMVIHGLRRHRVYPSLLEIIVSSF